MFTMFTAFAFVICPFSARQHKHLCGIFTCISTRWYDLFSAAPPPTLSSSLHLSLSLLCCSLKPLKRLFVQAGRGRARVRCAINYSKIIYFAFMYAQIYAASFLPPPPPTHAAMQASVSLTTYPSSRTKSAELLQCNWLVSLSFHSILTAKYLSFSGEIFLRNIAGIFNKGIYI